MPLALERETVVQRLKHISRLFAQMILQFYFKTAHASLWERRFFFSANGIHPSSACTYSYDSFSKPVLSRTTGSGVGSSAFSPISMSILRDRYHVSKTDHLGWEREGAPVRKRKTNSNGCCSKLQPKTPNCQIPPPQLDASSAQHPPPMHKDTCSSGRYAEGWWLNSRLSAFIGCMLPRASS